MNGAERLRVAAAVAPVVRAGKLAGRIGVVARDGTLLRVVPADEVRAAVLARAGIELDVVSAPDRCPTCRGPKGGKTVTAPCRPCRARMAADRLVCPGGCGGLRSAGAAKFCGACSLARRRARSLPCPGVPESRRAVCEFTRDANYPLCGRCAALARTRSAAAKRCVHGPVGTCWRCVADRTRAPRG